MSAAATAIASGAAAQSAANSARIREMERQRCIQWMPGFTDAKATVEQRQAYAVCVDRVYPEPMTGGEVVVVKAAILVVFAGVAIGAWMNPLSVGYQRETMDTIMGGVIGGLMAAAGCFALWLGFAGVAFLVS